MVTGFAVDAAGLAPGWSGVAVVSSDWFVEVVQNSQVGGRGVSRGTLQEALNTGWTQVCP